jgi:ankyrin repeat protein
LRHNLPITPIHKAAALGRVDTVRALLDAEPTLVNLGSRRGLTPLHAPFSVAAVVRW